MKKQQKAATIAEAVRRKILSAVMGKTDVTRAIADTLRQALSDLLGPRGHTSLEASVIIATATSGAVWGAIESGCDVRPVTRGLMVGVLGGTRLVGSEVSDSIARTAQVAMTATAKAGRDVEDAATGLIEGAIEGANEIGISVEDAAGAAALGALNAAGDVRSSAYQRILATVTKTIGGVSVIPKEPAISLN